MTLPLNVELQLDKRSAASVASDAERELANAGRNISQSWRTSMSGAGNAVRESVGGAVQGITSNFGVAGRAAEETFGGMVRSAGGAALGIAGVGLAAVAVGKQVYDLGAQWDNVVDSMAGRTGKIGDELTALKDAVRDVASVTASPIAAIGDIAAQVSQATRLTGADLENMTAQIANFNRVTGQEIDVRGMGKTFRLFDVDDAASQVDALNALANASWATGVPINELVGTVGRAGKATKEFGLDIGQTAALLVTFEQAGLNISRVESSLSIALKNFAKDGREPAEALRETITEIKNLADASDPAAAKLAQDTFGRGYLDFLNAIKSGRLDVDALSNSLSENGNTIQQVTDATADFSEEWQKFTNNLSSIAEPAATSFFNVVNAGLSEMINNTRTMFELKPSDGWDYWGPTLFGAAWMGDTGGDKPGSDSPNSTQGGNRTSLPTSRGDSTMPSGGWYGGDDPGTTGSGSSSSSKPGSPYNWDGSLKFPDVPDSAKPDRPAKPVVPYSGDPTSLIQGFPQTSALYGAAESVLNARHDHDQAEAELNALEADNQATAEEIQTARNKLAQADSNTYQTELRLNEAKASANDKYMKQMQDATGALDQLGASLDKDLGVSKGLAGIADNLVRFLGSLALSGPMAQMAQTAASSPSQGGYGAIGIAAAQGAFGQQYNGIDYSKYGGATASAMGPAAYGGGMGMPVGGGQPYGMPAGSNSGGYGGSGAQFPDWVNQMAAAFGIKPSTYGGHQESDRNEPGYAPNPGHQNRGIDWTGPTENLQAFADYLKTIPGTLEQVIWQNPNTGAKTGIAGGQINPGYYDQGTYDVHGGNDPSNIHVHTRQSESLPVPGGGGGGGGGLSPQQWNNIAGAEASGNWGINTGNGFSGGLQFAPSTWNQFGGQQYAPQAWQASPQQQMDIGNNVLAGQGPGAWPATSAAHPTWFQPGGGGLPSNIIGGAGQGPVLGGAPGPGVGASAGGPQLGAAVEPTSNPQGGGFGITQGGMIDTAVGLAASAFPGLGQAAQTGMKLANRAIQYGGQVAGIATQGALDTFLPWGGSELASKNWLTRLVGAAAGASPALPNMAGKAAAPLSAEQAAQQQGQPGQQGGPINQGVQIMGDYHQNGTEDQASSALASHLTAQNTRPGP